MTIPPYDDELQRLSHTDEIDFGRIIDEFFRNIFGMQLPQEFVTCLQVLMWTIVGAFILFILYREFGISKKSETSESEKTEVPDVGGLGTVEDVDIRGHNFIKEIQNAVSNRDFAKAIHLRYLMTIQQLDIQQRIKWTPYKTPMMYVGELANGSEILRSITVTFLYIKYGHYPAMEDTYNAVNDMFNEVCFNKKGGEE